MDTTTTRTWAETDLGALEHNYRAVMSRLGGAKLICVVKADGYGHGAVAVSRRLEQIGADMFAVATPGEAFQLRDAGITRPILILGVSPASLAPEIAGRGVMQTVTDVQYARELSDRMRTAAEPLAVHLEIDTGMGRLGLQDIDAARDMIRLPGLRFDGVFTHFASADELGETEYTRRQYQLFAESVRVIERESGVDFRVKHCANSAAALGFPHTRLGHARAGLLLYGYSPLDDGLDLIPALAFKTRIVQIKRLSPGDRISYGGVYTAEKHGTAAVLPVGYADGLHRSLSGKIEMLVRGRRVPQIGRICMDMCVIDVTGVPGVQTGDEVTVFGKPPAVTAREAAALCGTIPYEILCAVSARVPRVTI